MSKELIKRAFDSNAWIYAGNADGQAVAPEMFDEMVREYETKDLVVAPLAQEFDFTRPGSSWTVTIDAAPTAAALTSETDAAAVSAISNRQVTFTPKEYTKKYEASYTEMEDGFLKFMENASKKIGYAHAQIKDEACLSALYAGASNTVYANGKTATSDLESTDVFGRADLLRARNKIRTSYYKPAEVVISPTMEAALLNSGSIYKANEFGTRAAIENGVVGNLYGMTIYVSDNISVSDNVGKAVALGRSGSGEKAFGVAVARRATLETDKDIDFRKVKVVGSQRFDVKVLHPDAVVVIEAYEGLE